MTRVILGLCMVLFVIVILRAILTQRIELRDSILWLGSSLGGVLIAIFPDLLLWTRHLGFQVGSNALLSFGVLFLMAMNFLQTLAIGRIKSQVRRLAQNVALNQSASQGKSDQASSRPTM